MSMEYIESGFSAMFFAVLAVTPVAAFAKLGLCGDPCAVEILVGFRLIFEIVWGDFTL